MTGLIPLSPVEGWVPLPLRKRRRRDSTSSAARSLSPGRYSLVFYPPSLALLSLLLLALLPATLAVPNSCLRFADYDSINQLFTDGGPGTKVFLCPNKLYRLSGTIIFTAADQELATYGYPEGKDRAILRSEGVSPTAIQGDCRRCARVGIRNIIIDGNRKRKGRIIDNGFVESAGLIVIGGNEGQTVSGCTIRDPRGFTGIHVREGDKLSCSGAVIEKNEIGPVGDEYDPSRDGDDPENSPLGRPLADGISIACKNSIVRENSFVDNTDAAVVLYCSPGTVVEGNAIRAEKKSMMAGILMVDATPFEGDYTGTIVRENSIDAASRAIRVGIGIGTAVWSDDTETIVRGGSVRDNVFRGDHMGYGIAAAGLENWTVLDNVDEARYEGKRSERCFDDPINPDPMAFMYTAGSISESSFQEDFEDRDFQYVVCIDGVASSNSHAAPPAQAVQAARKVASEADEEDPEDDSGATSGTFHTGSDVLDNVLLLSQQRMLEAINQLRGRLDGAVEPSLLSERSSSGGARGGAGGLNDDASAATLGAMLSRISALETRQKALLDTAGTLRLSVQKWDKQLTQSGEQEHALLHDLHSHLLHIHPGLAESLGDVYGAADHALHTPHPHSPKDHFEYAETGVASGAQGVIDSLLLKERRLRAPRDQKTSGEGFIGATLGALGLEGAEGGMWGWAVRVILVSLVAWGAWTGWRRWRSRRRGVLHEKAA